MTNNYNLRGRSLTGLRRWWFMLAGIFLLTLFGAKHSLNAQSITNYTFAASSGTFTPVSGGTSVPAILVDDAASGALPIGFNFIYMGQAYTSLFASSNGILSFGAANASLTNNLSTGTGRPIIAPLWDDLAGTVGAATYITTGASGNRVFTFEWLNWRYPLGSAVATISMQCNLYEADGKIEFIYQQEPNPLAGAPSASVGLAGPLTGAGNFLSLDSVTTTPIVSSTVETTTINARPATGQIYSFTPPAAPASPTGLSFSAVTINSMTLNWTDATGEAGYIVERSLDGVTYTAVATLPANTISYVATGLSASQTYYWNIRSFSEGQVSNPALNGNQATAAGTLCGTYIVPIDYPTLTDALNAIRTNGLACSVEIWIDGSIYSSAGETFPIWIGGLGTLPGKTVKIVPIVSPANITSAHTWATIVDSLAEYVTIDGRDFGFGPQLLTIQNTANSGAAMRVVQESSNNNFQYINFRGQNNTTTGGVVFMGGSTVVGGSGNDNNLFNECDIHDNGALFPVNGFMSAANTTGASNDNNTISNCRVYNFFSATLATIGINLTGLNNNWSITGNRIYQDAARTYTTGNIHKGIVASNTLGSFTITNNIIGYATSAGTGTYSMAWAATAIANRFFGMDLNVAISPVSTISGNQVANFNIATSSAGTGSGAPFCGIWLNAGGANITGNTVGSMTGTDNILVRGTATGGSATTANVIGIAQGAASASTITISNNNIGGLGFNGITAAFANAAAIGGTVCGIFNQGTTTLTAAGSNRTISGNTIGGNGIANSMRSGNALNAGFTTTANFSVVGILNTGSTRMNILNNTVQNLSVPTRSSAGVVYGIHTTTGINTISGNTVHTLTSNAKNVGATTSAHLAGISHTSTTAPVAGTEVNIAQNTVRNLKINSDSSLVIVNGISYTGSTTTGFNYLIQRNNIYDIGDLTLTASDTAKVTYNGIGLFGGIATVQNNMISLGDGNTKSQVYQGIAKSNTNINKIYHNSVYIGGTASTASGVVSGSTWAFRRTARPTSGNDEIINNIFYNARTTAIGGAFEYATGLDSNINVTASKNILFADFANGGRTGIRNATIATSMTDWRTLTGQDLNSISENPNYIAPAAGTPDLHLQVPPALVPAEQAGQLIASVVNDFDGDVRAAFTPNDIGADAGNFLPSGDYINPVISSVTATPSTGGCAAVAHDVLAVATDASGFTSVTLNWSLNGVAQVGIPMTNTSGNNWEAQLPASGSALVTYSVTAIDASVNLNAETSASQSYRDAYLQAGLSAGVDQTICPGTSTNLSVASPYLNSIVFSEISGFESGSVGAGAPAPGITGFDYIELTNIGNQPVDISGWRLEVTGTTAGVYIIPAGNTVPAGGTFTLARTGGGAAIPGYYVNSTLLSVGSATSQGFIISDLGGNISDVVAINGGTPFNPVGTGTPAVTATMWSGNIASSSSTAGIRRTAFSDSNTATDWTVASAVNLTNWGTFNVGLGTINVANISWSSGGTGSVENVTPVASPTQYIVTLNDGICTATDTVNVNWFTTLPAPIGYDSTHCGNQQALCDVSTVPGAIAYRWYTTPTGGTPIQNLPDTNLLQNVAVTTTFYVAAFDGVCDGPRVAVTETVITPDPVDIVVTANDTICLGDVATLDATNANPNYVFIWSGNGVGTLNVNNVQTVVSTPLAVGNYTFIVTATDAGAGCVTTDTIVLVVNPNPNASANIDQTTICDGESVQLEVSGTLEATIGNNDAQNTNTSYPAAYGSFYWGHRQQILIRASELSAAGFTAGPINSLGFNITTADPASLTNYTISMAHTAATDLSLEQTVGSVVYGPVNYTAVVGVNTHSFTTPFNWDGTSNVVIQTCFNNSGYTNNSVGSLSNTSYISCRWLNQDAATVCTSPIASTASSRPQMILNGTSLPSGVTFSWSPATGLSATNISNPVATPSTSTTYVVTVTDPVTGCFTNDTVIINVLPVLPAPTTNPSAHCGNQIPTASVNAVPGATAYYWYDAAIGGTILQADPSLTYLSSIGTTTTLYVAAFDGSCLSPRTPVTITVATPPAITAQASDSSLCAGTNTINLDEILSNYITYTWSSDAGGNLNSTSGPSVTASPSAPGIYNYIVEGTDGVCTNSDTVTVEVFDLPTVNANIESAAFCEGGSVQLDVPTTVTIGENDVQSTTTGYPSAYGAFYWGYRMQNMILASELLANGFSAGAINALSYNIATPAGQTLTGYTIKMANVVAADLSTEQTVSTVVYGPVNYNSTAGLNTHTFSTPFVWDGVSNVVIETCFNNGNYTTNSVGNMDNTSFVSSRWLNQDAAGVCLAATGSTASQRPQMVLTRALAGVSYSWSPAAGLSATNIPNPIASPTASTNYVVTVTDNVTGCTNTDTVFITVTPLPAAPTTNNPISRCGPGDVTATATGSGGTLFWTGPNGGNVLSYTGSLTQSVTASGAFDVREFPANIDTTAVGFNPVANPGSIPVGYFPTTSQGMWFRVNNTGGTIIKSVDIYPNGPIGTPYGIAIIDSLGNTIGSVSGVTTVTLPNYETIELNIYVPYSTIPYAMRPTSSPNLSVHQDAIVQSTAPWQIGGEMNIIGYGNMPPLASFFGTNTFGMFYNWQVMHGCFGNEATVNYTVTPAPTLVITPSGPTTFCGSGVVTLDAGALPTDPGYVNFSWAPATGLSATNVASVVATVSSTTTYTVTADDGIPGGCINTATVTLTVNTEPFASVGIVPDTICTTSPFQFNGSGGSASYKYVGTTENLGQTAGWPFNGANAAQRMQLFVSAAELNAAGVFGPSFLNSVGFNVVSKLSNQPYTNFTVSIDEVVGGCFASTTYITIPGGNTVYTGNYSTTLGWNDIVFQTPYAWDGVSDIVIQTCFTNATNSLFDIVYTSQTLGCTSTNALNAAACGAVTGALTDFRPNMRFQGGSVNYSWSPATELNASNIANPLFTQSLGAGSRQYVLTVTDPVSGCTATDTANFYVSPTPVTPSIEFVGLDTTICISGTVSFSSIFVDGSLQWQSSTDNVNFFDVIGQTGSTYTTGLISADTYIRLKAFCADSAYSNVKYVKVNNPQILSTINDTVCGQGNVSLQATANPGYFIRWYADSTSGNYLTNGSPYNTFVTQTDTFWVAALVDTLVGSGGDTLTTTFAGGNGASGNFFNVNVTSPVTLTGMRINNNTAGAVCEVWYRSGTHVGFEGSSAGWTQIFNGPVAAAQGYVTGLNLPLSNGITSFFVFLPAGGITYTNGVSLGAVYASDANLAIQEGYGTGGTFGSGLFGGIPTSTRIWNGSLIYSVPNCVSARVPVIAKVNPAPAVTVTPSAATICEGSSVNINVTGGLGDYTNFDWAPATGLDVTSGPAVIATPSVTTSYIVTATGNVDGCETSDTAVITVNPAPVISVSTTTPNLCSGDTAQLSVVVSSPVSGNYSVTSIPHAPSLAPLTQSAPALGDEGTQTVNLPFNFNFGGTNYSAVTIHANGQILMGAGNLTAQFQYTPPTIFSNLAPNNWVGFWGDLNNSVAGSITYDIVGAAPNRKLVVKFNAVDFWSVDPAVTYQIELNETSNVVDVFLTSINTISLNARAVGLETNSQGYAAPGYNTGTWTATNQAFRFAPLQAATISWSGQGIIGSTTTETISAVPTSSGYYTVVVTNPLTGCTKADSVQINFAAQPSPVIADNDTTLCNPDFIYVNVVDTGLYVGGYPAGTNFTWSAIGVPIPDLDSISSSNGSSYSVIVTLPNGCSASSDTASILTKSVAVVDVITPASCTGGGSIAVQVTSGLPNYNYIWSTDLAQTNIISNVTKANNQDTLSNLTAGTYYLQVYDEAGSPASCNSGVLTYVVSGSSPIVIDSVIGTDISCNGFADGSATVFWTGGTAPYNILWSDGNTNATRGVTAAATLTVIVSDNSGCADTSSVTVNEPASITLTLSSTNESAPGANDGTASVVIAGGTPGYVIEWYDALFTLIGSGTPITGLTGGTYTAVVTDTNGCQGFDNVVITTNTNAILNLTMLIEGMYDGAGGLVPALQNSGVGVSPTECDTIRVEIRDQLTPGNILASGTAVLGTNGQASFTFPAAINGANGYIAVFHRNAVQTWSDLITFSATTNYNFTTAATQAYSSNMIAVAPGVFAFYSGDIAPQDEVVDITDQGYVGNDILNFAFGYVPTDVSGDGVVDITDQAIVDNNILNFVGSIHP